MAKKKFLDEFYLMNIKRHAEMSGKIHGKHFALVGPNGQGKTTVFQVIRRLLASLPESDKPAEWLKQGAEDGIMRIALGNDGEQYVVEEKIKKGARSRIRAWRLAAGKKDELTPAQERIRDIFGQVMDLSPLMGMTGEEQFEHLRKILNIDLSGYIKLRSDTYARRTEQGRKMETAVAVLRTLGEVSAADKLLFTEELEAKDLLAKKIDIEPILNRLQEERMKEGRADRIKTELDEHARAIQKLEKELSTIKPRVKEVQEELDAARLENTTLNQKLLEITEHNKSVERVRQAQAKEEEAKAAETAWAELTKKIQELDAKLNQSLATLPMGDVYPGLQLHYKLDDAGKPTKIGLFLNDLPFHRNQLSLGQMIKAIIKLSIWLNPEGLSFVYIGDWAMLDTANKEDILKFAAEHENVQLGIEKVDDRTEIAIEFIDIK